MIEKGNCVLVFFLPPLNSSQPPSDYAYLMVVFFFFAPGSLKKTSSPSSVTTTCFLSIDFFLDPSGAPLGAAWQLSTDLEEESKSEPEQSIEIVRKKKTNNC